MKKSLFIALTIAAGAATAAPYYLPTTDYTRDLPPRRPSYDSSAPYSCPGTPAASTTSSFGIEIGGNYIDIDKDDIEMDIAGFDVAGVYNINENWSLNLRFSYSCGDRTFYDPISTDHDEVELSHWTIAPGVRYTAAITDTLNWYIGANVGIAQTELTDKWVHLMHANHDFATYKEDASGVTYTIETGVRIDFCDNVYLYGSAMYWGTTAATGSLNNMNGYGFRAGLGLSF